MIITGRVIDEEGLPIPLALVHDGQNGIQTADNGEFELNTNGTAITATMVGYQEVTRPAAAWMEFKLTPDENSFLSGVEIVAQAKEVGVELLVIVLLIILLIIYL